MLKSDERHQSLILPVSHLILWCRFHRGHAINNRHTIGKGGVEYSVKHIDM